MRLNFESQSDLYRVVGGVALGLLTLGFFLTVNPGPGTPSLTSLVLLADAIYLGGWVLGLCYPALRRHFGWVFVASAVCVSGFFSLWLFLSDIKQIALTSALISLALTVVACQSVRRLLTAAGLCSLLLLPGGLASDASSTSKIIFVVTLASSVSILTLLKLHILGLTEDRDVERKLRESLFDQLADALMLLRPEDGSLQALNLAAKEAFGSRDPQAVWRCVNQAFVDSGVRQNDVLAQAVDDGEWSGELAFSPLNGKDFIGRVKLSRLASDSAHSLVLRVTDVTDLVAQNAALAEAKQHAELAMSARSRFLANMSHEIRTPMNGVIGMASLLNGTPLSEEQRSYVGIIRTSGESLLTIINEILDFSKLDAARVELETEPFALEACVADAIDAVLPQAQAKGLPVVLDLLPEDCRWFIGDSQRLRQVLVNLLSNALKFTERGHVSVRVRLASTALEPHPDEASVGCRVEISVTDTGIGIPAHKQAQLFDAFTQADSSTTRRYGGTGLGLSICRSLVELMGGKLRVDSAEGAGACFSVHVFVPAASAPELGQVAPSLSGRALLLESHADTRRVIARMLERWKLSVSATDVVGEFYSQAQRHPEALCFVDAAQLENLAALDSNALTNLQSSSRGIVLLCDLENLGAYEQLPQVRKPVRPSDLLAALTALEGHRKLKRSATPVAEPSPSELPLTALGHRVLLAEDNPVNQQVALRMLAKLGIEAELARNGREAVQCLSMRRYDVVFMDMQMPEVDGLEATRLIRLSQDLEQPYIIAMTANARPEDRTACLEAGMQDFIAKPVRLEDLSAALKRANEHVHESAKKQTKEERARTF
ncbi:MAG: ATP-binding protein [Pseudomonadota bacterium]